MIVLVSEAMTKRTSFTNLPSIHTMTETSDSIAFAFDPSIRKSAPPR
jgi:hypothetical protein